MDTHSARRTASGFPSASNWASSSAAVGRVNFPADAVPAALRAAGQNRSANTLNAADTVVLLAGLLRTAADQDAGVTGELVIGLR
jgi:hypothetical protein